MNLKYTVRSLSVEGFGCFSTHFFIFSNDILMRTGDGEQGTDTVHNENRERCLSPVRRMNGVCPLFALCHISFFIPKIILWLGQNNLLLLK